MFHTDMKSATQIAVGLSATLSGDTPAKGNIVDVSNFENVTFAFQTGTVTDAGTAAGITIKLQESDTTAEADFADVATADQIGDDLTVTDDAADDVPVGTIGYIGTARYVRAVATGTTLTDAAINGIAVLQNPRYAPPAATAASIAAT